MRSYLAHLRLLARKTFPLLAALLFLAGCAGKTVTVKIPPLVDLRTWPLIGVVDFSAGTHPELAAAATKQFLIDLQRAQPGLRLLELGSSQAVLEAVNRRNLDPEAIKAIGDKYGVDAVLTGNLEVSQLTPDISFSADLKSMHAKVSVKGELFAKLQETSTGASVWSNGAHSTWSLARGNINAAGLANLGITPATERYDQMLRDLSWTATGDFRPHYEKRHVQE
jgi:hypothetical protein